MTSRKPLPPDVAADAVRLGSALRAARLRAGLSVEELASRVGFGVGTVRATEEGRKRTRVEVVGTYAIAIHPFDPRAAEDLANALTRVGGAALVIPMPRQAKERTHDDGYVSPRVRKYGRALFDPASSDDAFEAALAALKLNGALEEQLRSTRTAQREGANEGRSVVAPFTSPHDPSEDP